MFVTVLYCRAYDSHHYNECFSFTLLLSWVWNTEWRNCGLYRYNLIHTVWDNCLALGDCDSTSFQHFIDAVLSFISLRMHLSWCITHTHTNKHTNTCVCTQPLSTGQRWQAHLESFIMLSLHLTCFSLARYLSKAAYFQYSVLSLLLFITHIRICMISHTHAQC